MQQGYIKARIYTSQAQIPIEGAAFSVYKDEDGNSRLLGTRISDLEGETSVIAVNAPDKSLSESQGNDTPFATVDVRIDHPLYRTVYVKDAQIFAGEVSIQEVSLHPLDRNVPSDSRAERFDVPKQNL